MDVRLKKVKIQNFRSIKDIEITFSPEVNLLVGPNGGGKSNILRALGIYFKRYSFSPPFDKNPLWQSPFTINVERMDNTLLDDGTLRNQCFHMAPLRVYESPSPVPLDISLLSSEGKNLAGTFNYYKSSVAQSNDLELFSRRIKRIIPEVENVNAPLISNWANIPARPAEAELRIKIKKKEKELIVKSENATSGTLDAIFLVFLLQILPEGSVYLLDSPDSHLHAGSQIAMMELIREVAKREKKQFIIATHSPTVVGMCSPEEVVLVTKKEMETTATRVSDMSEVLKVLENTEANLSDIVTSMNPV